MNRRRFFGAVASFAAWLAGRNPTRISPSDVPVVRIGPDDLKRRFPFRGSGIFYWTPYVPLQVTPAEAIFGKQLAARLGDNPLKGIESVQPMKASSDLFELPLSSGSLVAMRIGIKSAQENAPVYLGSFAQYDD